MFKFLVNCFRFLFALPIFYYKVFISAVISPSCIFTPTCSVYAIRAVMRYGVVWGYFLGFCRVVRCNPFARGGLDPVPEKFSSGKKWLL